MKYTRRSLFHFVVLSCLGLAIATAFARAAEPRFEKEIKAFEEADKKSPPPADAVLFVGSSSIVKWKTLKEDFPDVVLINRGFGGSVIADSVRYAPRIVIPYKPRLIVFYAGDNDIAGGASPQKVRDDFEAFVHTVRNGLPEVPILFIAIKPSPSRIKLIDKQREANGLIQKMTESDANLKYVDVFTPMLDKEGKPREELFGGDKLHMSAKGYELWTSILKPYLK